MNEDADRYPVTANATDETALRDPVVRDAAKRWGAARRSPDGPVLARFARRRTLVVLFALVAGICFAVSQGIGRSLKGESASTLWDFVDPGIALATVITTIAVWLSETKDHWLASLEKRLTIVCVDVNSGRPVLHCDLAPLAHEGDVRQSAVSMSAQMCRNRRLEFRPRFVVERPRVVRISESSAIPGSRPGWVREYRITLLLDWDQIEDPEPVRDWVAAKRSGKWPYVVWGAPDYRDPDGEMPEKQKTPKGPAN